MDIEEIAKTVTRKDFLEEAAKDSMGKFNCEKDCPNGFGLIPIKSCKPYKNCRQCWKEAIKNIKFKGEEMEKDYDREYNIKDILDFEEGTEFEVFYKDGSKNQFKAEVFKEFEDSEKILIWSEDKKEINIKSRILNAKFKLVKKDKEVSFMDAVKEYNKGRIIYCIYSEREYVYTPDITMKFKNIVDDIDMPISSEEIIKGKWFVKEEN